jgi:serine/threonine protein phosphatase PrpC
MITAVKNTPPTPFKPISEVICRKWLSNTALDPETKTPITDERKRALMQSCKWIGLYQFNPSIKHIAINDQMRSHEDRYIIQNFNIIYKTREHRDIKVKYNIFAVIDGHNGSSTCDYIKQNLYPIIKKIMENKYDITAAQDIRGILNSALKKLRSDITENIRDNSGAVMCVLFSCKNQFVFGWIGDVRGVAYITKQRKLTRFISTIDHTFETDMSRLRQENAELKKDSNGILRLGNLNIPRAFGDAEMSKIAGFSRNYELSKVFTYEPRMGPMYIVLGSDGMWNIMSNKSNYGEIMRNIVIKYKFDQQSLTQFIKRIRNRSKENDDITLLAITVTM